MKPSTHRHVVTARARQQHPQAIAMQKKVQWHSAFGRIVVTETQLRLSRCGALLRRFCQQAHVHTRGYDTLLQRVLTDFGAEAVFLQIPARVWEQYGIELPASSARAVTLRHAHQAGAHRSAAPDPAAATVLAACQWRQGRLLASLPAPPQQLTITFDRTQMIRIIPRQRDKGFRAMKPSLLNWLAMLLSVTVAVMPLPAQNPAPSDDVVRKILQERLEWKKLPGIVVGIVDDRGQRIIAVGKPTRDSDRKLDGDSVFEIGSATKVFTALLLAEMAERGEVSLDDSISKFLPKSVTAPTRDGKEITLRHLAQHMSGLPRLPDNFEPKDANNPYADYSVAQLYEFLSNHKLSRDIGEKYEYSNLGTGLLGHLLALKAGKDYEALVIERVCKPLVMNDTRIALTEEMKKRMATGHDGDGKVTGNWDLPTVAGAGALRSTANDLVQFLAANFGSGETKLFAAMQKTYSARADTPMPNTQIALGWHVRKTEDGEIFWHDGGTGGYRSFIGFNPKKKRGVVALSNSVEDLNDIGMHLLDEHFELNKRRVAVAMDPKVLDAYVGQYQLAKDFMLTVRNDGGRLFVQATGQGSVEALPESETKFFSNEVNAQITFVKGEDGKVTHLILHQGGDHEAKKISDEVPKERQAVKVDPKIFDDYAGSYQLVPGFIITVTRDGNKLMAQATAQPKFEIFPESETKFFYKVVDAQITFVKDKDGKVTHIILHQGGDREAKKIK